MAANEASECPACGALVGDAERHYDWHHDWYRQAEDGETPYVNLTVLKDWRDERRRRLLLEEPEPQP